MTSAIAIGHRTPPTTMPMTTMMMGYWLPPLLACATTMVSGLTLVSAFQSTSIQWPPSSRALCQTPTFMAPSPLLTTTSKTALCAWNRELNGSGGSGGSSRDGSVSRNNGGRRRQQRPLRAYTVADNIGKPTWFPFVNVKFPLPFADVAAQFFGLEDSLFSFEGGGATGVATRPLMPNLELEEVATATSSMTIDVINNDVILSELDALTETFADLESSMDIRTQLYEKTIMSYEYKVTALEEKNLMLEAGLQKLTLALDKQEEQLLEMRQVKGNPSTNVAAVDKSFDVEILLLVQENVQTLEDENANLRQRVRALELELSEAAFESRKVMPAPIVAVASSSNKASVMEASVSTSNTAKLLPKAPSIPVPPHILQQQLGQLHMQSDEYKLERSGVLHSVGRGLRNGVNKVGRALNLWNPAYNLMLWGELKGH